MLGLFGSIYSIGSLAGLPFAPFIADRFGRKKAIWCGCVVLFAGVAAQSAATEYKMFIIARFFGVDLATGEKDGEVGGLAFLFVAWTWLVVLVRLGAIEVFEDM
jgi:MFS family permease